MKKIYIKENKMPLLEYYNSPDNIYLDDDDEVIDFEERDAVPFIVLNDLEILVGEYGKSHFFIKMKMEDEGDDRDIVAEGRIWCYRNIISFWYSEKLNVNLINHVIFELFGMDLIELDDSLKIAYKGDLMTYNDFLVKTEKESDRTMEQFEKGLYDKTDYYSDEDNEDTNDIEDNIKNIHLMKQQDKRNALSDYRKNKEAKLGKQLSTYDEDGNFKSEMPMAQWRALHSTSESKEIKQIIENLNIEVEPSEVDLSSFNKKKELNPNIWDEDTVNSRVRLKLLDIADDFFETLNIKWIKPLDIILTGSICNYNWSEYSDIDLHIVINFSEVGENKEIIKEYFNGKKNEWNNEHEDLNIFGLKVELYVQDSNENAVSSGIYSLEKNEWIKKPSINNVKPIKDKKHIIKLLSSSIMTKIDDLWDEYNSTDDSHKLEELSEKCDEIQSQIKQLRINSLDKFGEFSIGNICYKVLRRFNYLDDLWDLKIKIYDKINSIE